MEEIVQEGSRVLLQTVRISGKTKDGVYAAEKPLELATDRDNVYTFEKVITDNGYQNVTIKLDPAGRLLAVQIERWDLTK